MRHSSQRSSLIITEQRRMNMGKLTYIRCGDYDIPNLKLSAQPETSIGKYGRMRKSLSTNAPEKAARTPRRKLKSTSIF